MTISPLARSNAAPSLDRDPHDDPADLLAALRRDVAEQRSLLLSLARHLGVPRGVESEEPTPAIGARLIACAEGMPSPRATREVAKREGLSLVRLGRRVFVDADEWAQMLARRAQPKRPILAESDRASLAALGLVAKGGAR